MTKLSQRSSESPVRCPACMKYNDLFVRRRGQRTYATRTNSIDGSSWGLSGAHKVTAKHISNLIELLSHRWNVLKINPILSNKITKCVLITRKEDYRVPRSLSHDSISRTSAPLWHGPSDVLSWHLDATALAVNTVLRIDDNAPLPTLGFVCLWIFVHSSGTESLFRTCILSDGQLYNAEDIGCYEKGMTWDVNVTWGFYIE